MAAPTDHRPKEWTRPDYVEWATIRIHLFELMNYIMQSCLMACTQMLVDLVRVGSRSRLKSDVAALPA